MRNFWIVWWWGMAILVLGGCGSLNKSYVEADLRTYEYAAPKLVEWSEQKAAAGDQTWVPIVKDKNTAWRARIDRALKALEAE